MKLSEKENFDVAVSLTHAARTATTNGSAVDLQGYQAATLVVNAQAWTDGTHAFKLQDSPDNSTWTDVAAAQLDGTGPSINAAGGQLTTYKVGYLGNQRYIRAVQTCSGTTTGAIIGAIVVRTQARKVPK